MIGQFHIGKNGPAPCHAKIKCRLSGGHYETLEEANKSFEMKNEENNKFKKFSKDVKYRSQSEEKAYITTANVEMDSKYNYLKMLERRQFNDTLYQDLKSLTNEQRIKVSATKELKRDEANLGFVDAPETDDKILGIRVFTDSSSFIDNDFYDNITEKLNDEKSELKFVQYEQNGKYGIFTIKENDHFYTPMEADGNIRKFVDSSFQYYENIQDYSKKTPKQLKAIYSKRGKPIPQTDDVKQLVRGLIEADRENHSFSMDRGYSNYQRTKSERDYMGNLRIVSNDPVITNTMKALTETYKKGYLKVSRSSDGNMIFYDERDRSMEAEEKRIIEKHFKNHAENQVSEIKKELENNGKLDKLVPLERKTNLSDAEYFVSYKPNNSNKTISSVYKFHELKQLLN